MDEEGQKHQYSSGLTKRLLLLLLLLFITPTTLASADHPTTIATDHSPAQTNKSQINKLHSTKTSSDPTSTNNPKQSKTHSHNTVGHPKSNAPPKTHRQHEDDDDLISEFRGLPYRFQETFVPDLGRISKESRIYLTTYHNGIAKGFKPYVGNRYAATIAPIASFSFIILPLILVSLVFNRITASVSLHKILIFAQFYLAAYFAILGLSSLVTGIEPLRFFYSASQSTYVCVQVLQTLAYGLYLLLLLVYLILALSPDAGPGPKLLGMAQAVVGLTIGLHYYVTVFHRAVLHQPPKSGWKAQFLYATCYLVIGLLGTVGWRKKAYLAEAACFPCIPYNFGGILSSEQSFNFHHNAHLLGVLPLHVLVQSHKQPRKHPGMEIHHKDEQASSSPLCSNLLPTT